MNNNFLILFAIIVLLIGSGYMYWDKTNTHKPKQEPEWQQNLNPKREAPTFPEDKPLPKIEPLKVDPKPVSYPEAVAQSKKTGKKMVLYFGATWCTPCQRMSPIFATSEVQNVLNNYVFFKMDVDQTKDIAKQYKVGPIPSYCIADSNEQVLKQATGAKSAQDFINWLKM